MNSDEILRVLNDLEPVDMTGWTFCVISDAPDNRDRGFWPFEKGEILVLNAAGREPFAEGRKPAKWDVAVEEFAALAEAEACREQVLAGTWPRSYA